MCLNKIGFIKNEENNFVELLQERGGVLCMFENVLVPFYANVFFFSSIFCLG